MYVRAWFMFTVANASIDCRKRLVRLLTHPSAQPLCLQFLLGRETWSADMFDLLPSIDIEHPKAIGSFFSAYLEVAHCPKVQDAESINKITAALAVMAENCNIILLGPLARPRKLLGGDPHHCKINWLCVQSGMILELIRPSSLPDPVWHVKNKMLPLLQNHPAIWNFLTSGPQAPEVDLKAKLKEYFRKTRAQEIPNLVKSELLTKWGLANNENTRRALRIEYGAILKESGLEYMTIERNWLRKLAILWVAIITQAKKTGLVSGPHEDNRYALLVDGLDWSGVSRLAQGVAPPELQAQYTKHFCFNLFRNYGSRHFNQQMLYVWNWVSLEGEFSMSP